MLKKTVKESCYCIENDILKDFFLKERRAITMFSLYEYDYEGHMNLIREEGREEGREKGHEEKEA